MYYTYDQNQITFLKDRDIAVQLDGKNNGSIQILSNAVPSFDLLSSLHKELSVYSENLSTYVSSSVEVSVDNMSSDIRDTLLSVSQISTAIALSTDNISSYLRTFTQNTSELTESLQSQIDIIKSNIKGGVNYKGQITLTPGKVFNDNSNYKLSTIFADKYNILNTDKQLTSDTVLSNGWLYNITLDNISKYETSDIPSIIFETNDYIIIHPANDSESISVSELKPGDIDIIEAVQNDYVRFGLLNDISCKLSSDDFYLSGQISGLREEVSNISSNLCCEIETLSSNLSNDIGTLSIGLSTSIQTLSSNLSFDISCLSIGLSSDLSTLSNEVSVISSDLSTVIQTLSSNLSNDTGTLSIGLSTSIQTLSSNLSFDISCLSIGLSSDLSSLSNQVSAISSQISSTVNKEFVHISGDFNIGNCSLSGTLSVGNTFIANDISTQTSVTIGNTSNSLIFNSENFTKTITKSNGQIFNTLTYKYELQEKDGVIALTSNIHDLSVLLSSDVSALCIDLSTLSVDTSSDTQYLSSTLSTLKDIHYNKTFGAYDKTNDNHIPADNLIVYDIDVDNTSGNNHHHNKYYMTFKYGTLVLSCIDE